MSIYEKIKAVWIYIWPTLLLPLGIYYGLDYVTAVVSIGKVCAITVLWFNVLSFLGGIGIGIAEMIPGVSIPSPLEAKSIRLYRIMPTIGWGQKLVRWSAEESSGEDS